MGFLPANFNKASLATRANEVVNKSSRLGEGRHHVTIDSVEFEAGNNSPYLKVTFKNEQEETHQEFIFLMKQVWDNGKPTGESTVSDQLFLLLGGIGLMPSEQDKFIVACNENVNLFQALVGTKLVLSLAKDNKGVDVRRNDQGNLEIFDVSSDQHLAATIAEEVGDTVFEDWNTINDFLKERRTILRRAYLRVKSFITDPEVKDGNTQALRTAIQAEKAPVSDPLAGML